MPLSNLYSLLNLEDSHCAIIHKVASTSEKSQQVLLGMMIRKNRLAQSSINLYFTLHRNRRCKSRAPKSQSSQKHPRQRILRISVQSKQMRPFQEISLSKQLKADALTPRKKPFEQKQHVRAQSKLSIIQFPTYAAQLHLSASKKLNAEDFVRKQLSNLGNNSISDFDKTPLLSPSMLSSNQQQLLMDENQEMAGGGGKQNRAICIRVRTFKSFQQHESARIGTSRPTYLKPIPAERFFTRFQSQAASRAQLIHPRYRFRRGNM